MKHFLLSVIFLFCNIVFAKVDVQLETNKIQAGQTFTLSLKMEGSSADVVPDLTPLQQDFIIVGTERSFNYSLVNGQASTVGAWSILLKAKRSGVLTIPSLQVGKETTTTLSIEVTTQTPTANPGGNKDLNTHQDSVFLIAEVDVPNPYINQQVTYTVKLYNNTRLLDANYQPPTVDDALLVPFGESNTYQVTKNGRIYAVEEQKYALFPQKSGVLKINPPVFNGLIYDVMPKRISMEAKPIVLDVKPVPASFQMKDWLAAKQVNLSESYDKNNSSLPAGSTLVRTVSLKVLGVPAQLLPILQFPSSNQFSIYPEKPAEYNSFEQQNMAGTTSVKVTYLLNKSGKIVIPAIVLPWFNLNTGKIETASLPALTIDVTPAITNSSSTSTATTTTSDTNAPSVREVKNDALFSTEKKSSKEKSIEKLPTANIAWWLAGFFALAWLITLVVWIWSWPKRYSTRQAKEVVLRQLHEACRANQPRQARDALLKWGRLVWPKENILNLAELEHQVNDIALKHQIRYLSEALYHTTPVKWEGEALWEAIITNQKAQTSESISNKNNLPPLHRL